MFKFFCFSKNVTNDVMKDVSKWGKGGAEGDVKHW